MPKHNVSDSELREHVEQRVRAWFGEPMLAVEDEIVALLHKEREAAEQRGIHIGIEHAEAEIGAVIKKYHDERYGIALRRARTNLRLAFKRLHQVADQGVNLKLTPVHKSRGVTNKEEK